MGFLANIAKRFGYTKSEPQLAKPRTPVRFNSDELRDFIFDVQRDPQTGVDRGYNAAKVDRLTSDWINVAFGDNSKDAELKNELKIIRSRARDLCNNNDYAKRYINLIQTNVVGPNGFKLQVKSKSYDPTTKKFKDDADANDQIERAFKEWCKPEYCTVSGRLSFRQVCDLIIAHTARDGEMFVKLIKGKSVNKFGFALQLIEPDHVDEKYSVKNEKDLIVMGVKINKQRAVLGYYVKKDITKTTNAERQDLEFVPVDKMYHLFDPERADQTRGVSWMAQSIIRLKMLDGYEEASLVNARASAAQAGFFETDSINPGEYEGDELDANENLLMNLEPGIWQRLPPGIRAHSVNPEYPHPQHEMFMTRTLMGIASGLGVSYSSLSGDYSKANYSSERASKLDERDRWKRLQAWFIDAFLNPMFGAWLEMALLTELKLPSNKYEKFNAPVWYPKRWEWVDPQKDITAKEKELGLMLTTRKRLAAEQGDDFDELIEEIKDEQEKLNEINKGDAADGQS